MANSEEYTLIWAGIICRLTTDQELSQVESGSHPLVAAAQNQGLEVFCDTFDVDPIAGEIYSLLLGARISLLGYKEGITTAVLDVAMVTERLENVKAKLALAEIADQPALHILLHIQY